MRLGGKPLMLWAPKTTASPHGSARNQFNVMRSLPVPWLSLVGEGNRLCAEELEKMRRRRRDTGASASIALRSW